MENQLFLTACIAETKAMRYTPAGLPALDLMLEHESTVVEAGQKREVQLAMKGVAIGAMAERLAKQAIGSDWRFTGFLSTPKNGKQVVLHIQEFEVSAAHSVAGNPT